LLSTLDKTNDCVNARHHKVFQSVTGLKGGYSLADCSFVARHLVVLLSLADRACTSALRRKMRHARYLGPFVCSVSANSGKDRPAHYCLLLPGTGVSPVGKA